MTTEEQKAKALAAFDKLFRDEKTYFNAPNHEKAAWITEFERTIRAALAPGEVTQPTKTKYGLYDDGTPSREIEEWPVETRPAQEPVAWRVKDCFDKWVYFEKEEYAIAVFENLKTTKQEALYDHPPASDALLVALMLAKDCVTYMRGKGIVSCAAFLRGNKDGKLAVTIALDKMDATLANIDEAIKLADNKPSPTIHNETCDQPGINKLNPDMPTQELLLHMGELTRNEIKVARAAIRWANTCK